jgi:hypothetical protein
VGNFQLQNLLDLRPAEVSQSEGSHIFVVINGDTMRRVADDKDQIVVLKMDNVLWLFNTSIHDQRNYLSSHSFNKYNLRLRPRH